MSDYSDLATELMKTNPIVKRTFIVRVTIEEHVQRESGIIHLKTIHDGKVIHQSETLEDSRLAFAKV